MTQIKKEPYKYTSLAIPESIHRKLRILAAQKDLKLHELFLIVLKEGLKKIEPDK